MKVATSGGVARAHLEAIALLSAVEFKSIAELRESGASSTVATLLKTMALRGFVEVRLLPRPEVARGKVLDRKIDTKCYRVTSRGQKALDEVAAKLDELEHTGERPAAKPSAKHTGRAPDVGRFRIHPWNGGGGGGSHD